MLPIGNIVQYQVAYVYPSDTETKKESTITPSNDAFIKLCIMKSNSLTASDIVDITNLEIIGFIHITQSRILNCPMYTNDEFEITENGRIHFTVKEASIRSWGTSDADRIILFCK